jgi:hypothetical protein
MNMTRVGLFLVRWNRVLIFDQLSLERMLLSRVSLHISNNSPASF